MTSSTGESECSLPSHSYRRLICSKCGQIHDVPLFCGDRFCPVCSAPRRARFRRRVQYIVGHIKNRDGYRWRFITLTIPNVANPSEGLNAVFASFRKLRQRKAWKARVFGGVAGAEVTYNGTAYHVHLHAIVFSRWFPQTDLCKLWRSVSAGKIVDIRIIPPRDAAAYFTKYVTKTSLPADCRKLVSDAFRSRRLYTAFGACHSIVVPRSFLQSVYECRKCGNSEWICLDTVDQMHSRVVDRIG